MCCLIFSQGFFWLLITKAGVNKGFLLCTTESQVVKKPDFVFSVKLAGH